MLRVHKLRELLLLRELQSSNSINERRLLSKLSELQEELLRCHSNTIYYDSLAQESQDLQASGLLIYDDHSKLPMWLTAAALACMATVYNPGPATGASLLKRQHLHFIIGEC